MSELPVVIQGSKGGDKPRKPVETPNNLKSTAIARIMDLVSEGEILGLVNGMKSIYLDETPLMNADGTLNFSNVQVDWRYGSAGQDYIPGFPGVENELSVGVELTYTLAYERTFTNTNLNAVRVRLSTPALSKTNTENGDITGHSVSYTIEVSTDSGPFVKLYTGALAGKTMSKYERDHRIELPPATTGWIVRVRRTTPNATTSNIQDKTYVESMVEIIDAKLRYPHSAVIGITMDASQFNSIPSRAYDLYGRIIKVPSNYNAKEKVYTGTWDGTFQLAWSDNPAWIYYDLVLNDRYGLGHLLTDANISKWDLYSIAKYCDELVPTGHKKRGTVTTGSTSLSFDATTRTVARASGSFVTNGFAVGDAVTLSGFGTANDGDHMVVTVAATSMKLARPSGVAYATQTAASGRTVALRDPLEARFTCNLYLQKQIEAYKAIADLATVFRGISYWGGGQIHAVSDKPETPIYTYTPANVIDGKFTYQGTSQKARHTVALVSWNDMTNFGRSAVEYVDDPEGIARYGLRQTDATALGCTSQSQAQRLGRYLLTTAQYETQTVTFAVGLDGTLVAPGSVVRIADPLRAGKRMGGRVMRTVENLATYAIQLDNTGGWSRTNTSIGLNATGAPDGTTTADKLIPNATNTSHYLDQQIVGLADNEVVSASIYVKKADYSRARLDVIVKNGSGPTLVFDFTTKTITSTSQGTGGSGITFGFEELTGDWFKLKIENINVKTGATVPRMRPIVVNDTGASTFAGDTVKGTYYWGAQLNRGATVCPLFAQSPSTTTNHTIVLDEFPGSAPVAGDELVCIMPSGIAETRIIAQIDAANKMLSTTVPFSSAPADQSMWTVNRVGVLENQLYRVLGVAENTGEERMTYAINAVQHNPSKFSAVDFGTKIEIPPTSSVVSMVQLPPTDLTVTHFVSVGQSLAMTTINVDWKPAQGAVGYDFEWRRDNGEWNKLPRTTGTSIDLPNMWHGVYQFRVRAVNSLSIMSPHVYRTAGDYTVPEQTDVPGFVDLLEDSIADALNDAANAQATADGAIVSFWSTTPPAIGPGATQAKLGDIWFDTDDGNKIYRVSGTAPGTWQVAADDDMALAIDLATDAQATADGKVKTYFAPIAPLNVPVGTLKQGDLWFDSNDKKLYRWDGGNWSQNIGDVTAAQLGGNGVNVMPADYSLFEQSTPPTTVRNGTTVPALPVLDSGSTMFGTSMFKWVSTGSDGYVYFNSSTVQYNIPLTPGKKWIVSFYCKHSVANAALQVYLKRNADATHSGVSVTGPVNANTIERISVVIDLTAHTTTDAVVMRIDSDTAGTIWVSGIMIEEQIGTRTVPSAYSKGTSTHLAYGAIIAASAAQITADGKIDLFRQATAPASAYAGDIWVDSDDNKMYVWTGATPGGSWVLSQDTQIGDAILAAAGAQATADGKIKTYFQNDPPTDSPTVLGEGDLWVDINDKNKLYRWNNTTNLWVLIRDGGIDDALAGLKSGSGNILPNASFTSGSNYIVGMPASTGWNAAAINLAGDPWHPPGMNNLGRNATGVVNMDVYADAYIEVPAIPGNRYCFSAYVAAHRGKVQIHARFIDSAGSSTNVTTATAHDAGATAGGVGGGGVTMSNWIRQSIFLTAPTGTVAARIYFRTLGNGNSNPYGWFLRPMIEVATATQTVPSEWSDSAVGIGALTEAAATNALQAINNAAVAQSTADGKIQLFKQASPPVHNGTTIDLGIGDIWIDTDDNKMYVREGADGAGGTWVNRQDSQIGAAINAAAGAQGTADGKATTYYSATTPAPTLPAVVALGDLWFNSTTKVLTRWDGSAWVTASEADARSAGSETIANADFEISASDPPVGWSKTACNITYLTGASARTGSRSIQVTTTSAAGSINSNRNYGCTAGEIWKLNVAAIKSVGTARVGLRFTDGAGALVSFVSTDYGGLTWTDMEVVATVPANAVAFTISLRGVNSGDVVAFDNVRLVKTRSLDSDVTDGVTYGRVGNTDLYNTGGVNRIGLRFGNSGHRLGNQRNIPRSNTSAYGMVRSTAALTATSAGVVSVNAHTVRYGGYSVAYTAVASAITGLTQGVTYVIYCVDADLSGGLKSYLWGTNPDAVMQVSDDIYVVGQIKIPTSGSSSGGSGGTGGDPTEWCVDAEMLLPDGRRAGDVDADDEIMVWDEVANQPGVEFLPVESNTIVPNQPSTTIRTASGAEVTASNSTPMTLRDGRTIRITEMAGEDALVRYPDGALVWEPVTELLDAGLRTVAKIKVHQRCYFAGLTKEMTIATHNPNLKP